MSSETLPAGQYFMCDPCYVIPDEDWDRFINEVAEETHAVFTLSNGQSVNVWYASTEFGDGTYLAESYLGSTDISVDSGCIGVVEVFDNPKSTNDIFIINPKRKFEVSVEDGTFKIASFEIQTGAQNFEYPDSDWFDSDFGDYDD